VRFTWGRDGGLSTGTCAREIFLEVGIFHGEFS